MYIDDNNMTVLSELLLLTAWMRKYSNGNAMQIVDNEDELKFSQAITKLLEEHREVVTMLAEGFTDCRRHIQVLQSFMSGYRF